jgi:diguanylate cyclase (GGDEF)-like protein
MSSRKLLVKNLLMDRASKIDALTDCYNHKNFHEHLDKITKLSESNDLLPHLAIIDVDNFKKVNDTFGHWVGDIVLKSISRSIKELVTPDEFRYGGEEFAVIFTGKTLGEAYQILNKIRLEIAHTNYPELDNQCVTVSIGLQRYVQGEGKEKLFKDADYSLYTSKKTGKNKISTPITLQKELKDN